MAVAHAGRAHHREGALDPAQQLDARAVQQQAYLRVQPDQPVDVVVGLVGDVAETVVVAVPAQVVAPVVAAAVGGPLLLAAGDVLDLLAVAYEGVAGDAIVLRAGGEVDAQGAVGEAVAFDAVEQRVVDEQRLALGAGNHRVAGAAAAHALDTVAGQGRVGDVVHQDAVVLVVDGAVAGHGQLAALHQRVAGAGAPGQVVGHPAVVGEHVVHAVAQVLEAVGFDAAVVGGVDVDPVAGVADPVAADQGVLHRIEVDAVAAILGAHAFVALDAVVEHLRARRGVEPDAEARAAQVVAADHGAAGGLADEDRGVEFGQVAPPVAQPAALDGDPGAGQGQQAAVAAAVQFGAGLAA